MESTWNPVALGAIIIPLFVLFFVRSPTLNNLPRYGMDPGLFDCKLPLARFDFFQNGHKTVKKAYHKSKQQKYFISTLFADRLVLPPSTVPELRNLPRTTASHAHALCESRFGRWNGLDVIIKDRQSHDIARGHLTNSLPILVPLLADELQMVYSETLAECTAENFTPFNLFNTFFPINLRLTTLAFAGRALSRNKEFTQTTWDYQRTVKDMSMPLLWFPEILRYVVRYFVPATYEMPRIHKRIRGFLFPKDDSGVGMHEDMPTMAKHYASTSKSKDELEIVAKYVITQAASLHSVTHSMMQAIFDLCERPQYIEELRSEANSALAASGNSWTFGTIKSLRKLDSFLKESQRMNPQGFLGMNRLVLSSLTLSDGTTLPKGQYICVPAANMSRDPEYVENPDHFDGYRFCKGDVTSDEDQHVGTSDWNVNWGHGRSTCPGRWFASATMKLWMASLLLKYDFKYPESQSGRPMHTYMDEDIVPSRQQEILFRLRE